MEKFYSCKIKINKEQNSKRLDQALAKLSNFTRSQIKILLNNNNIKKDGKIAKNGSYRVKEDEVYDLNLHIPKQEKFIAEDIPLNIMFEDEDIIIINKVAGMVTHPAPGNNSGTLVNALLNHTNNNLSNFDRTNRPGIVHRLDKETSGIMVVAKNNKSHLNLANQFKEHSISRKYNAIVWGTPQNQTIEGYIERHRINRKKMSLNNIEKGKYSKTSIKLKKIYNQKRTSLIKDIRNKVAPNKSYEFYLGGIDMIADDTLSFIKSDIIIFGFSVFIFICGLT